MDWLNKNPTEIFKKIPQEKLLELVNEKQQLKHISISTNEIMLQLMSRHILNKHLVPNFVINSEDLNRWLLCIYILE